MKILHSADWHLDSPLVGRSEAHNQYLRQELLQIPEKIASMCRSEGCDLLLLAGDLFDGSYTQESFRAVSTALRELKIPVFIAPGNHDFCAPGSPYLAETWPENVHIFHHSVIETAPLPELDCKIYGAGFEAMDCQGLLKDFLAEGNAQWHIGLFHGDPMQASSPYCPITSQQVRDSGLSYLALGHIHKAGSFRAGDTLCAWPGCPMGRGYDEPGIKGALLVTLEDSVIAQFLPLNTPRFYDEAVDVGADVAETIDSLLPPVETTDAYRITLTGYSAPVNLTALSAQYPHIPYLELRDRTLPEVDLWSAVGEDSLEGVYFKLLQDGLDTDSEKLQRQLKLAAKISRQILDGQEVVLP
ncbi:MAG: DNA repair exonuclease [Ruminococcaceae bacterium]|nr:DNA repair exonuclease [Oscillospiraceae bacterium]